MKYITPSLIIPLYFLLIFLLNFGAIDVIGVQWLYLSIINFVILLFLKDFKLPKSSLFLLFSFFIFQVFFSLIYSLNINLSTVDAFRHFSILTSIIILFNIFSVHQFSFKRLSLILSIFLFIEVFYSLRLFFSFFLFNNISNYHLFSQVISENDFIGFAGNKNINAASIAIKLPFLFYSFVCSKFSSKILYSILSFFIFLVIFFLRTRSVYLSVFIILFFASLFFINRKKFSFLYLFIPISLAFMATTYLLSFTDSNAVINDIQSINFSESSSNSRFFLWDNAISYISEHPFVGSGIGNWKIESIPYWNTHLSSYTVPYHAHNDFLEITTELGILGGLTYLFFFLFIFFFLFRQLYLNWSNNNISFILVTLFLSFIIYFIDLNLNFPGERPRIQIMFSLLFACVLIIHEKKFFNP